MACGNNHVSRAYLSSPPTPVVQALGALAVEPEVTARPFVPLPRMPISRQDTYVDQHGIATRTAAEGDRHRHVHVVYNFQPNIAPPGSTGPTGMVLVQVTDRTYDEQFGVLPGNELDRRGNTRGHHEATLFIRPPSPEKLDQTVSEAVAILHSRRGT